MFFARIVLRPLSKRIFVQRNYGVRQWWPKLDHPQKSIPDEKEIFMNLATSSLITLILSAAISATSAFAADPAPAKTLTPQQQKMKDCNAQAADKKGDDRKAFMSQCLKGGSAAAPAAPAAAAPATPITQQQKMKNCNVNAGNQHLAGDARKTYMSTCLKGDGSVTPAPSP
jgi:psiF repeat